MRLHSTILLLVFLAGIRHSTAQENLYIRATVSKNTLLLGEPVTLTINALVPDSSATRLTSPLLLDHFEVLGEPQISTDEKKGNTEIKAVYTITSFDSGHWVIPPFSLAALSSDSIPMDVVFTSPFDTTKAYHDIKDVVDVKAPAGKKEWWIYAAGGALLLLIITWWLLRKKQPAPPSKAPPAPAVNAYQEALQLLEQLEQEKPAAREFYSRLTDIFRLYIFRKKGILSLQKTTNDLVKQVKPLIPETSVFEQLSGALQQADFVKFAKYSPSAEDNQKALADIKNVITQVEQSAAKQNPS